MQINIKMKNKIKDKKIIIYFICILLISILAFNINADITPGDTKTEVADKTIDKTSSGTGLDAIDKEVKEEKDISSDLGLEKNKIYGQNLKLFRNKGDKKTRVLMDSQGILKINGETYSSLGEVKYKENGQEITKTPQISIDSNGKIVEEYFTVGKEGKYFFGNEEINLPQGSKVVFKDGVARIAIPAKGKISAPKSIDNKDGESSFYYSMQDNSLIPLLNGDGFYGELGYKKGNWFFDKDVKIGSLEIKNPGNALTYIDFKGEINSNYDGAYISIDKTNGKIVIGNNGQKDGPAIKFLKDNSYGLLIQEKDHFSVKALADPEKSYLIIKDRTKEGLVPLGTSLGRIAINEDKASAEIIDGKLWLFPKETRITEFGDQAGTTTVPFELNPNKLVDGKSVLTSDKGFKFVFSNSRQMGYGVNPSDIKGEAYNAKYPLLKRRVSNQIYYNYPSIESFQKVFGIPVKFRDDYSRQKMTEDKVLMLMDMANGLTPTSRKWLQEDGITVASRAGGGAIAWGWAGGIKVAADHLEPGTVRHEMSHAASLGRGGSFDNGWYVVGGGKVAFTSNYGTTNADEDLAEYGGEFLYKDTRELLTTNRYAKYYRAKLAYLTKTQVFTQQDFDLHMSRAGLETGPAAVDKYIREVTGK